MNFGFIVHPISPAHVHWMGVRTLQMPLLFGGARALAKGKVARVARFPHVASPQGETRGTVWAVPETADSLVADQARAVDHIAKAIDQAVADGAQIVGLGAVCAVVGLRGEAVAERVSVPVTTGVSFTAFAAVRTLEVTLEKLGEPLEVTPIVITGLGGSLAAAIAYLLQARGATVILAGGSNRARQRLADELGGVEEIAELEDALATGRTIIGASSTGGLLRTEWLQPGTLVIDVAEPRDLPPNVRRRADVLAVDGENVSLPSRRLPALTRIYNSLIGQRHRTIYACFAEPIVLALEERAEPFSLGKHIDPAAAEEIGALGAKHGFAVSRLLSRGRRITPNRLNRFKNTRSAAK